MNQYTLLEGGTTWSEELDKKNQRALAQRDRYNQQVAQQGEQWVAAQEQKRDLLLKLGMELAPTAVGLAQDIDESLKQKTFDKLSSWNVTSEANKIWTNYRNGVIKDGQELERLTAQAGMTNENMQKFLKLSGRQILYKQEFVADALRTTLYKDLHEDKEFQQLIADSAELNDAQRAANIQQHIQVKYIEPNGISDGLYNRLLKDDVNELTNHYNGELELKNLKVEGASTDFERTERFTNALQSKATVLVGETPTPASTAYMLELAENIANGIPKFITTANGEKIPNVKYNFRHEFAKSKVTGYVKELLKQEPPVISPDQRETMLTGLMEHKGFKSPKNPNGNVEVKDGFFDKDTLAELQDTHEAAIKSWISKSDDEKEAANELKVFKAIQYIDGLKTYKEKKNAIDTFVRTNKYSNDALKEKQAELQHPDAETMEGQIQRRIKHDTISTEYMNNVKKSHPALYSQYEPIVAMTKKDAWTKIPDVIKNGLKEQISWSPEIGESAGAGAVVNWISQQARDQAFDKFLQLPPEARTPSELSRIIAQENNLLISNYQAMGGGGDGQIGSSDQFAAGDERLQGLFAYNSDTGRFPHFDKLLFFKDQSARAERKSKHQHMRRRYSRHGVKLYTEKIDDNTTYITDKPTLLQISRTGVIPQSLRDWAAFTPSHTLEELLQTQGDLLDVDLSETLKAPLTLNGLAKGDAYITALNRSNGWNALTANQIRRLEEAGLQKEYSDLTSEKEELTKFLNTEQSVEPEQGEKQQLSRHHEDLQAGLGEYNSEQLYGLIREALKNPGSISQYSQELQNLINRFTL